MTALVDEEALAGLIRLIAREERARPELVTQRNVGAVLGMPPRDFLRHCRARHWPSFHDRRLRYARTADVLAWLEAQQALVVPGAPTEFSRSRSGLRRVAS